MITENTILEPVLEQKSSQPVWLEALGWFFSGFILPIASFTYYRKAAQKSVGITILFFVFFTVSISSLSTINIAKSMFSTMGTIGQSYANGDIPEITISNGIAKVNGEQPFVILEHSAGLPGDSFIVMTDTSGVVTEIDTNQYGQGFLLTRTELHIFNPQNGYQVLSLLDLNLAFEQDPILINAGTVSRFWAGMSVSIVILTFLWLVFWFTVVRLMFISTVALVIWGIVSLIKPGTGYGPIIISGLYAIVPAVYLAHLFERSEFALIGVETFLLFVFWVIGLVVTLVDMPFFAKDRALRLWTAFIGLPMLFLFVVDIFVNFPYPYGSLALWGIALFTGLVLIGLRVYFRFKDENPVSVPEINE